MSVIIDLFKTFEVRSIAFDSFLFLTRQSNPEDLKLDFPILKKINMRNEKLKAVVAHKLGKNQNQHPTAFPKMTKSVVDMVLMNQPVKPVRLPDESLPGSFHRVKSCSLSLTA